MKSRPLNSDEKQVLEYLSTNDEACFYFRSIAKHTAIEQKKVRRICRALARRGLTQYVRGLFDDDGMVAGSGYGITVEGLQALEEPNPLPLEEAA